jgi:hypothetical protein
MLTKKRVLFKSKLGQIEITYNNNETKKFYQEVNSIVKEFKRQTLLVRGKEDNIVSNKEKVRQRWSEYYEKHFELQDGTDSDSVEEWTMCIQAAEPYVEPPNDVDVEMTVGKLENGKIAGHDPIPARLIKEGGKELKKAIYELT